MPEFGRKLRQWLEHKTALGHARMWYFESRRRQSRRPEEQYIQVDQAWPFRDGR